VAEVLPVSEPELRVLASLVAGGIRFMVVGLSAAAILASKEAANRPKDRLVIPVLRDALLGISRLERKPDLET
jgi:hypothetical protein